MWSSNATPTPRAAQQGVVTELEIQALFQGVFAPGDNKHLPFEAPIPRPIKSVPVVVPAQENLILRALSTHELEELVPHLERLTLVSGQVIGQPGYALRHVYFPLSCSVSWVSHTTDGESAELALVGRDGLIGAQQVLGGLAMQHTVQVQCGGQALRMGADVFQRLLGVHTRLHKLTLLYVQWQLAQMAQSIVCSRHHSVAERLSYWMLSNAQGANTDELHVTHENISHMLGVRRESVTQAAGRLQDAGWIRNSRGKITLKNNEGLRHSACECHVKNQAELSRYLKCLAQLTPQSDGDARTDRAQAVWPPVLAPYGLPTDGALETLQSADELQKYVDAYDFAPVGFVTLDTQGRVVQTNLAGAILLDIQRSQCRQNLFADFLDDESRAPFERFHHEVLGGQCRRHAVVQLTATAHRPAMRVRIDATADEEGEENRMVLIDVSDMAADLASGLMLS